MKCNGQVKCEKEKLTKSIYNHKLEVGILCIRKRIEKHKKLQV